MVGIILYGAFKLAPYTKKYTDILDSLGIKYDLIGWRREEEPSYADNVYMYNGRTAKRFSSVLGKIIPSIGYRRFVKRLVKKKKYDMLIIFTTQTAVVLADLLLFKYRKKYIFDYRDKSYEYIKPYSALINGIIKASAETVVSSQWFPQYLTDKKNYVLTHNFRPEALVHRKSVCKKSGGTVTVGYVGILRSYEYHTGLIDCFAGDSRFEFHIYGCGDDVARLFEYAKKFSNIFIHGAYTEEDKYGIIDTFDIMCYNYPYSYVNDGAVANKYYDALIMKKPMFVNAETALGSFICENGIGVGVPDHGCGTADTVYNWYKSLDPDAFAKTCDRLLDEYIAQDENFYQVIKRALI